jgi:outer membrane receptor for monomeric catechols
MKNGFNSASNEVQCLVETLQNHITQNYYNCTKDILFGLGQMYVADERFRSNIDESGEGTAIFVKAAIEVYCSK